MNWDLISKGIILSILILCIVGLRKLYLILENEPWEIEIIEGRKKEEGS